MDFMIKDIPVKVSPFAFSKASTCSSYCSKITISLLNFVASLLFLLTIFLFMSAGKGCYDQDVQIFCKFRSSDTFLSLKSTFDEPLDNDIHNLSTSENVHLQEEGDGYRILSAQI